VCVCMLTQWSSEEPCRTESVGAVLMAGEGGAAGGATAGSSSAVGRVDTTAAGPSASPPPAIDMFCPIAENWCYTQASRRAPTQLPTPGGIDGAPVNRVTSHVSGKRHSVRWGPSFARKKAQPPPNFRPMSIVAKRLDG